jgi:predicted membrane metal-binding protein
MMGDNVKLGLTILGAVALVTAFGLHAQQLVPLSNSISQGGGNLLDKAERG